jgi:hypothetical protein
MGALVLAGATGHQPERHSRTLPVLADEERPTVATVEAEATLCDLDGQIEVKVIALTGGARSKIHGRESRSAEVPFGAAAEPAFGAA